MRIRLTAHDTATNLISDLVIGCSPDDTVERVLTEIRRVFPCDETAYLDGQPLPGNVTVAAAGLRDGALLGFGGPNGARAATGTHQMILRVLSGPSAGAQIGLDPGQTLSIGREPGCDLVVDDRDVTRLHMHAVGLADGVRLIDRNSLNGVWVDGRRLDETTVTGGQQFQIGGSVLAVVRAGSRVLTPVPQDDGTKLVNRVPRNPPSWKPVSLTFPTKHKPAEKRGLNLIALALPVVVAVALAAVMRQWYYLMFAALSPLTYLANNWGDRRRQKQENATNDAEYARQLAAVRRDAERAVDAQDTYLRALWPDVATVSRAALIPTVELWGRRPTDEDWLGLRLGVADLPAEITFAQPRPEDWQDPVVPRAPIGVSLEHAGAIGIAGPAGAVMDSVRWVLLQAAALHSPTELRMAVFAPGVKEADLGWVRWLPHLSTSDGGPAVAWAESHVEPLTKSVRELIDERRAASTHRGEAKPLPHYLILLAGAGELYRRPAIAELMARGPAVGVFFVCADTDPRLLPAPCRAVLELGAATVLTVEGRHDRKALTPDLVDGVTAEAAARALAPLRVSGGGTAGGAIPDQVRLADLVGPTEAETIRAGWRLRPMDTRAVVGHDGEGQFTVDLVKDGPHGLIAGTTRAGKSEFLMTLLTSLSRNNSPLELNFLFVDYKGGSTFLDLCALPHTAATLTNLDDALAERALVSLRAELIRRQEQLSEAGARDLPEYRRMRAADPSLPPFPRLLIVVDEFAELKQFLPHVVESLVGVARTGASLGVHLLLATQQPRGVISGDIRANTSLRICFRVADEEASRDVIDIPDAYRIPASLPGRAYVQNAGQRPTLIQTARITTPHLRREAAIEVDAVRWNADAPMRAVDNAEVMETDLHVAVRAIAEAAAADGLAVPYPVVLPPLPEALTLEEINQDLAAGPAILLGLRDLPMRQRQEPLTLPLGSGHLGIIGSGRSGRSSALRAIAAGLARTHPPQQVHLHVIDGGRALAGLAALPHCGVYTRAEDEELTGRLVRRLAAEMAVRRELLAHYGAAGIDELAASIRPPHVVLLVDGHEAFLDQGTTRPEMQELFGGLGTGLTVVVTGDESMRRMLSRFTHRIALSVNNPDDLTGLFGPSARFPKRMPPGRGVWGEDGSMVQIPLLDGQPDGTAQNQALAAMAARLGQRFPAGPDHFGKLRLEALPGKLSYAEAQNLGPAGKPGQVLLAVGGDVLGGQWVALGDHPRIAIVGGSRSGRTTAAVCIARSLADGGGSVLLTAADLTEQHHRLAASGVRVLPPQAAADADLGAFDLVVVDDADRFAPEPWLASLSGSAGPAVAFVTGWEAPLGQRPVQAFVKAASVQLVLRPDRTALRTGNSFGIAVPPEIGLGGPAGRVCVLVHGLATPGQVPAS